MGQCDPTQSHPKVNNKEGETESSGDSSLSNMRGIKRVGFCVKEGHPRDQQPPALIIPNID